MKRPESERNDGEVGKVVASGSGFWHVLLDRPRDGKRRFAMRRVQLTALDAPPAERDDRRAYAGHYSWYLRL